MTHPNRVWHCVIIRTALAIGVSSETRGFARLVAVLLVGPARSDLSEEAAVVWPVESATRLGAEAAADDRAAGDADGSGRLVLDDAAFVAAPEVLGGAFSFSLAISRAVGGASEPELGESASIEAAKSAPPRSSRLACTCVRIRAPAPAAMPPPARSSRLACTCVRIRAAPGIFLRLHPSVGMTAQLP